jgi:hypothetical protein
LEIGKAVDRLNSVADYTVQHFSSRLLLRVVPLVIATVLIVSGLVTYLLLDIPFGPAFNTAFHIAYGSLVLLVLWPGWRWLSGNGWWRKLAGGSLALLALVLFALLVIVHVDYTLLPVFDIKKDLTKQAWHEDLAYLSQEMERRHPDLFSMIPESEFHSEVTKLNRQIDTLEEVAIRAGLTRIVALPDDGHTFPNIFSLNLDWHVYPLAIHLFDDQLVIIDAGREHRDLIGSRITRIDNTPVAVALDMMEPYLSIETASMRQERLCNSVGVAEWLYAAGVASRLDRADYTLVDRHGRQSTVTINAVHYLPCMYWMMGKKVADDITSIAVKGERRTNYRFELLPDSQTLYFQFNLVSEEDQEETMAELITRLDEYVTTHDFERVVIDVRNNDGGNGGLLPPLVRFLAESERINREGRLFILISRRTHSAAAMFTAMMQNNTAAITVGENTSQGPNFFSGPAILRLPNSGMEFLVSSRLTSASLSCDRRKYIEPDVPVEFTMEDHFAGRDPCLEAAIAYEVGTARVRTPVSEHVANRIRGRYRFGPLQVLMIDGTVDHLRLEVTDFLAGSKQNINTGLHQNSPGLLQTDISGVEIRVAPGAGPAPALTLVWREESVEVPRMQTGERLPLELIQLGRIDEGVQGLLAEKNYYLEQVPQLENILNAGGYEHLRDERVAQAVALFRLNVELFPESSNVYDSLGEAYLAAGDREQAIANYRYSLELNPENRNASRVLAELSE